MQASIAAYVYYRTELMCYCLRADGGKLREICNYLYIHTTKVDEPHNMVCWHGSPSKTGWIRLQLCASLALKS